MEATPLSLERRKRRQHSRRSSPAPSRAPRQRPGASPALHLPAGDGTRGTARPALKAPNRAAGVLAGAKALKMLDKIEVLPPCYEWRSSYLYDRRVLKSGEPINMIGVMPDDASQPKPPPQPQAVAQSNPLVFKPRPETIRDWIHQLSTDTANIKWSNHALERMNERDISDKFVVEALRKGMVKGEVEAGQSPGEWKVKMAHRVKGRRDVGVVIITLRDSHLLVKTVEWEDLT